MLTSNQRAYLRALANPIDTILMVGKSGISADVIKQADDALLKRELIKGKTLETCEQTSRETAQKIAEETKSEIVQVIGRKFVLYRRNDKQPKITLPKTKKKG
ncbi:ribosome assembly RNA-binding protein YhbY [Caproicibacterium sp. BJN0003]|jgi:RNA-binding protein|uniref:ribosome assembly RNA-binding protein YhbY n=1 Tax=Caproicibacterium sp. BJN0003 TaxID=2994078 RepID=UPI0022574480|nr:ribosome assembly RNA-binding protein YhbY [Caproicibacterium sp. BJN0003]UZT81373.1 ribosome assembly RNA-binding protein YhbY [Caproicibacterium sp. BJN0003]